MESLVASGDPASALAHYRIHHASVRDELGVEPDATLVAYAAALCTPNSRSHGVAPTAMSHTVADPSREPARVTALAPAAAVSSPFSTQASFSPRRRRVWFATAAAVLTVVAVAAWWGGKHARFSAAAPRPPAHDSLRLRIVTASAQSDPADSALARRVRNSALAELEREPWLFVVTPQAWLQQQPYIGLDPAALALPDTVRKYARKMVTHAIVDFGVSRAGNGYILTAEARGASTDSSLGVIAVAAAGALDLPDAMIRLGRALRDSLVAARYALPPTEWSASTTDEPAAAITLYVEARSEAERGNVIEAARRAERATQVDSTFALAWRSRHLALANAGLSVDDQLHAISAAFRHSNRVRSPWARLDIVAAYYRAVGDHKRALVFYDSVARFSSDQNVNMGLSLGVLRQYDLGAQVYRRAIAVRQIKRVSTLHNNLVWQLLSNGNLADAKKVLDWMVRTDSTHFQSMGALAHFLKATRDWEALEAFAKTAIGTGWAKTVTDTALVMQWMGFGAAARGHIATFDSAVQAGATIARRHGSSGNVLERQLERARLHATIASDTVPARAIADSALAAANWNAMKQMDRPYPALLLYLASVGDVRHGGQVVREWSARTPAEYKLRDSLNVLIGRGELALASGNGREALRLFRLADVRDCEPCFYPRYARAFDALREPDSARVWFERYANALIPTNTIDDVLELPHTYRRLGELYEAKGDVSGAIAWYDRFTTLWASSDSPVPQAAVREVRAHVDELRKQRPKGRPKA
jgi:tetratricopeptide (TPR) repeat protein